MGEIAKFCAQERVLAEGDTIAILIDRLNRTLAMPELANNCLLNVITIAIQQSDQPAVSGSAFLQIAAD